MRISIGLLTVLCVGALSQAVAMNPPTSQSSTASAAPSSEPAASTSSPESNSTSAQAGPKTVKLVAGDADAQAQLKRFKAMGYKAELHGHTVLFCRKEPVLGSHFEQKACNSADELEKKTLDAQEATKLTQRNNGTLPHGAN